MKDGSVYDRIATKGLGFLMSDQCERVYNMQRSHISEIVLLPQPHEVDF